eukprot:290604-Lingulodinium_polyedra.AAC.1
MRPTRVQAAALEGIGQSVLGAGACPPDLDGGSALRELLRAKDLYAQEPLNLAAYDPAKLKVLRGG